jgi:hypothetical protein
VRADRAVEVVDNLADGTRLALDAAFFGTTVSETEARGRAAADLTDAVESGETTDARCGTADLAAAEGVAAEDNLPEVEVANVDDRAGGPVGFAGANDDLRVGAGAEEGAIDGLGGMAVLEDGAEVDSGFFVGGLDEGVDFGLEGV